MYASITRAAAVAAGAGLAGTLGLAGVGRSVTATAAQRAEMSAAAPFRSAAVPGARLWVKRYSALGNGYDGARSIAVNSSGTMVFVAGVSVRAATGSDYATVAYDAATGARIWLSRYNGPASRRDDASSVAVSPDGKRVFVTGTSFGGASRNDYATVAYDAATGKKLWIKRYNGPANGDDSASSAVVSPGSSRVFVTGTSKRTPQDSDYVTVAYSAATGAQLWVRRYNGPASGKDTASSLGVSPAGRKVFVTGTSMGVSSGGDYATVAYNAATGAQLWVRRYNGPANDYDSAYALAVGPGGKKLFVTGLSYGKNSNTDYATAAYNAATGALAWIRRYNGPANSADEAHAIGVSPSGKAMFVTGQSQGLVTDDYATIAYSTASGSRLWVKRYNSHGTSTANALSLAVSPAGGKMYVTGGSIGASDYDYATLAYDTSTGAQLWADLYNSPANSGDLAYAVACGPGGQEVFVTGTSIGARTGNDYATIAYQG